MFRSVFYSRWYLLFALHFMFLALMMRLPSDAFIINQYSDISIIMLLPCDLCGKHWWWGFRQMLLLTHWWWGFHQMHVLAHWCITFLLIYMVVIIVFFLLYINFYCLLCNHNEVWVICICLRTGDEVSTRCMC